MTRPFGLSSSVTTMRWSMTVFIVVLLCITAMVGRVDALKVNLENGDEWIFYHMRGDFGPQLDSINPPGYTRCVAATIADNTSLINIAIIIER
jgi:hypothetical protein